MKYFYLILMMCFRLWALEERPAANPNVMEVLSAFDVGTIFRMQMEAEPAEKLAKCGELWLPAAPCPLLRGISNYGKTELSVSESHSYQVIEITNRIPHLKGLIPVLVSYTDESGKKLTRWDEDPRTKTIYKRKRLLILKRHYPLQDDEYEGIFWHINAETGWIEQFESGKALRTIKSLQILSHNEPTHAADSKL